MERYPDGTLVVIDFGRVTTPPGANSHMQKMHGHIARILRGWEAEGYHRRFFYKVVPCTVTGDAIPALHEQTRWTWNEEALKPLHAECSRPEFRKVKFSIKEVKICV